MIVFYESTTENFFSKEKCCDWINFKQTNLNKF